MAGSGSAVVLAALAALALLVIAAVAPRVERFATDEPRGLSQGVGAGLGRWRAESAGTGVPNPEWRHAPRRWCKTACGGGFSICVDGVDGVDGTAEPANCAGCTTGARATEPTFHDEVQCRHSPCARCGAPAPGDTPLDQFNPVTGVGQHTDVRRTAERHARGAPLRRCSEFEQIPGRAGYMWPVANDAALSLDAARRDARAPGLPPYCGLRTVHPDVEYLTDGLFGAALLNGTAVSVGAGGPAAAGCWAGSGVGCASKGSARSCFSAAPGRDHCDHRDHPARCGACGDRDPAGADGLPVSRSEIDRALRAATTEHFTSARRPCASDLTASRVGLGSTRMDPRFQPGPPLMLAAGASGRGYGGDTNAAPGTHAGGPTLGALTPSAFAPTNVWGSTYVFGFGDCPPDGCSGQRTGPPEALTTGVSRY